MDLQYLQYQLTYHGIKKSKLQSWNNQDFFNYAFYVEGCPVKQDVLYVMPVEELDRFEKSLAECAVLVLGSNKGHSYGCNTLALEESSRTKVCNCLNDIFLAYERWNFAVKNAESLAPDILLDAATPILHTPMTIVNNAYSYLAKNDLYKKAIPEEFFSEEDLDNLVWDKEFYLCQDKTGIYEYQLKTENIDMLCYNIFIEKKYYARFIALYPDKVCNRVFKKCFKIMSEAIQTYYREQGITDLRGMKSNDFCEQIEELLRGKLPTHRYSIRHYRWEESHTYQIILFQFSKQYPVRTGKEYLRQKIETLFKDCCVIFHEMDYICIRNQTLSNESIFHEELSLFLRENVAKAGISNSFEGFSAWDMYMRQAYDAMELGREIHAHFWHYNFKDYALAVMLKESTKKYPAKELISPTLQTLSQYDEQHKTDLYHTLDVYLRQNCSATHTAKELYIQRSSVLKRLEKIKRLTHVNLGMYEEKIYIMTSYYIMEHFI